MTELDTGQVECYSGHTYAQEPRVVVWQGRRFPVVQVEWEGHSPEGRAFCVGTKTGERFRLHYHELAHHWTIEPLPNRILTATPSEPATQQGEANPVGPKGHNKDQEALI